MRSIIDPSPCKTHFYAWFNIPDFNPVYSSDLYLAGLPQQQKFQKIPLSSPGSGSKIPPHADRKFHRPTAQNGRKNPAKKHFPKIKERPGYSFQTSRRYPASINLIFLNSLGFSCPLKNFGGQP